MSDSEHDAKEEKLESDVQHLKLEEEEEAPGEESAAKAGVKLEEEDQIPPTPPPADTKSPVKLKSRSASHSPVKQQSLPQTPMEEEEASVETVGGDITLKLEPGKAPKLSRSQSQKIVAKPPTLYADEPDKTAEACSHFQVIDDCIYANKSIGTTEHALDCDCDDEWDSATKTNTACGEDSDCINRATKMECVGDCRCGTGCQNQRFQSRQYANVSVFKTEKKGYGLRADANLRPGDFIFEYIGEVINEPAFRRRMIQYDEEGIKHFYFMSLSKGEFVDATKRGNLGRFCNHSCNPNCYVDKWVVGDKLRMGIFAERNVKAGEELVFNYNVDRYGAEPQPCYCGEPNCSGFIGGKTQTERATKLSHAVVEALGIDDGDGWDLSVAKKPRKKRKDEDDEEYVNNVQPKSLDEGGVTKVMATLMQCKEKWIAVKLLSRIQCNDDERVRNRVVKMHGYQILKTTLNTWIEDVNVLLQVLDILFSLPRITRNKIQDSKIEETVEKLKENEDDRVKDKAVELLKIWSKLEVGYRIPRVKRDPNAVAAAAQADRFERRERARERSRSKERSRSRSVDAPRGPSAPSGPRSNMPQRNSNYYQRPPFRPRPAHNPLPEGWFSAADGNGKMYYYCATGETTWSRPTAPAARPPPPPKQLTSQQRLQEIINSITSSGTPNERRSTQATPATETPQPERREERWRSYSVEKQKKIYENTLFPHIQYVMNKYKNKLPRDDLKRFTKEVAKKLVDSDFKHNRVGDPTKISEKQEKAAKKYMKDFFDKAVAKRKDYERKKAEKKTKEAKANGDGSHTPPGEPLALKKEEDEEDVKVESDDDMGGLSEDEDLSKEDISPSDLKRKREDVSETPNGVSSLEDGSPSTPKKFKADEPPPPPPPPPAPEGMELDDAEQDADPQEYSTETGVEGSFTSEALQAVNGASVAEPVTQTISPKTDDPYSYATVKTENGAIESHPSPMQLATPSTNGSYPYEVDKDGKKGDAMNMERGREAGTAGGS